MSEGGACSIPTHCSGGGITGGVAAVCTSPSWSARSPKVASTLSRSTGAPSSSSWYSEAVAVESERPRRTRSVRTLAGPGREAER